MAQSLLPGTVLNGKYTIIKCLFSQDFCNVYLAEMSGETGKQVVIKELLHEVIEPKNREEALKIFTQEVENYKNLTHDSFISILDFFYNESAIISENKHFIVMEYISGKTLRQLKEDSPNGFSPEELGKLISLVCDGLMFLSNQNPPLSFYFLSPDHIIITEDKKVKLINFGLSRFFRTGPFSINKHMGIVGYSSPEQYSIKGIDSRSDIFGLGAVMYYMLTNEDPEKNPLKFSPVKPQNPIVSLQFARLIAKCIEMKPEERFQNFTELKEKLDSITFIDSQGGAKKEVLVKSQNKTRQVLGNEIKGFSQNIIWTLEKYIPVRQIFPLLILGFVAILIVYGIMTYTLSGNKFPANLIYLVQLESDKIIVMDMDKKEIFKKLPAGECKGNMLLFNDKIYISGPVANIVVLDPRKAEIDRSINIDNISLDILITKNGAFLYASNTSKGQISKVSLMNRTVTSSVVVGDSPTGLALSENERYLYVANFVSNNISVIDTENNTNIYTVNNIGTSPKKLCIIPGKKILYTVNWGSDDVAIINTVTNTIEKTVKVGKSPNNILVSPDGKIIYVSNNKSQSISLIDSMTGNNIGEIKLSGSPTYMCLSPDKKNLLISLEVSNNENKIVILNAITNDKVGEIPVNSRILSFVVVNNL